MLGASLRALDDRRDVLVVASFHSYSPDVVDAAVAAHARGMPVVAITDSALSPLQAPARVCFELGAAASRRSARWSGRCAWRRRWS